MFISLFILNKCKESQIKKGDLEVLKRKNEYNPHPLKFARVKEIK